MNSFVKVLIVDDEWYKYIDNKYVKKSVA